MHERMTGRGLPARGDRFGSLGGNVECLLICWRTRSSGQHSEESYICHSQHHQTGAACGCWEVELGLLEPGSLLCTSVAGLKTFNAVCIKQQNVQTEISTCQTELPEERSSDESTAQSYTQSCPPDSGCQVAKSSVSR